jgi:topoisomerase-4 subunit A
VIIDDKPHFLSVDELLRISTFKTVDLLKRELEIRKGELEDKWHYSSLEKIFIENRIYRDIEEAQTWEDVIARIDKGLKPHKKKFYREITTDDIVRLTEIRIKRISKFDSFKANEMLRDLEKELKETEHHLRHLVDYAIAYYQRLLEKYGKGRERKTEIKSFQSVTAVEVIANNQKLYVNRTDGFIGYGLKRDEYICDCSELDDVIVIRKDGNLRVSRIQEKVFMGKDILYVGIWKKGDDRMVYNVIYNDPKSGKGFAKRFALPGITRDKEYDLTQGTPNSRIFYVSGNPNGEAEVVEVKLSQSSTARKKVFNYDFAELEIKGRAAKGNIITKYPIRKVDFLKAGSSTLSKLTLWYDADSGRLNKDKRGKYLGKFDGDDKIICFMRNGTYKITSYELTNRYEPEKTLLVEKFNPERPISAIYVDGESKQYMVKRFVIETSTPDKEFGFISEAIGSRLVVATTSETPEVEVELIKGKDKEKKTETMNLEEIVDVKGWKAVGNRLSEFKVSKVTLIQEEETGLEEGDEENELIEAAESEDSQSPKKKLEPEPTVEEDGQVSLFGEPEKPKVPSHQQNQNQSQPRPKVQVEQQNLFGEKTAQSQSPSQNHDQSQSQNQNPAQSSQNESSEEEEVAEPQSGTLLQNDVPAKKDDDDKSFNVGETIEFKM